MPPRLRAIAQVPASCRRSRPQPYARRYARRARAAADRLRVSTVGVVNAGQRLTSSWALAERPRSAARNSCRLALPLALRRHGGTGRSRRLSSAPLDLRVRNSLMSIEQLSFNTEKCEINGQAPLFQQASIWRFRWSWRCWAFCPCFQERIQL